MSSDNHPIINLTFELEDASSSPTVVVSPVVSPPASPLPSITETTIPPYRLKLVRVREPMLLGSLLLLSSDEDL